MPGKKNADISTLCGCPMKTLEIAKSAHQTETVLATDFFPH